MGESHFERQGGTSLVSVRHPYSGSGRINKTRALPNLSNTVFSPTHTSMLPPPPLLLLLLLLLLAHPHLARHAAGFSAEAGYNNPITEPLGAAGGRFGRGFKKVLFRGGQKADHAHLLLCPSTGGGNGHPVTYACCWYLTGTREG